MKIFRIINRSFRDAFKSVFRNFSLSVASISCTTITLILVAIALLVSYNVNAITKNIEGVLTIIVFVDRNATDDVTSELAKKINNLENVDQKSVVYKTADEVKTQVSSEYEDLANALSALDENPLNPTFTLKVKNVNNLSKTAEKIKTLEGVSRVKYGESLVNKLIHMFSIIRNACMIAVIALIIVTVFLIGNTIKITIFSRRQAISIMRLVGTSNTVIKMPFVIEGFILGVIGSIIPVLLTIFGYRFLYDYVGGKIFANLVILVKPASIVYQVSLVILIVGTVVGMFGSLRAVKRFLKV